MDQKVWNFTLSLKSNALLQNIFALKLNIPSGILFNQEVLDLTITFCTCLLGATLSTFNLRFKPLIYL